MSSPGTEEGDDTGAGGEAPTFLVVDDEPVNTMLLEMILGSRGFHVITARSGEEAVERFREHSADMVLMDIMMPGMDGYEATRQIKAMDPDGFVPVLFVTALSDERRLAQCVEAGGDDFITKPISRVQLNAKIDSWLRTQSLYRTVTSQRDDLDGHQRRLEIEQETAERIVARATNSQALRAPGLSYHYQPAEILSGDIILAAYRPNGNYLILLGDFTGHGIGAAVGVPPLATLFHDLTRRGGHPGEMLDEINEKLFRSLPPEMFLTAALVEVDLTVGRVGVWNAGMPPILMVRDGRIENRFESSDLPLGVVRDSAPGRRRLEYVPLPSGVRLYGCSDGVVETLGEDGALFGVDGFEEAVVTAQSGPDRVNAVVETTDAFGIQGGGRDDLTLFELEVDDLNEHRNQGEPLAGLPYPARWQAELTFDASTLVRVNPLPPVMNLLSELGALEADRQSLYVVIAELYTNALEHGVLALDSSLKQDPDGFEAYYRGRAEAMENLEQGEIVLRVGHDPQGSGAGCVVVEVEDSGAGFDYEQFLAGVAEGATHGGPLAAGRGIILVHSLCSHIEYYPPGNRVRAIYQIGQADRGS